MYKFGICGHFGGNKDLLNGQTVKTKILTQELRLALGSESVQIVDTYGWRENPAKLFMKCFKLIKDSENIIILPAHNGVKIFVPLFALLNTKFQRKIHYAVIGGWLPEFVKKEKYLLYFLKKFNNILVETSVMKAKLNEVGLSNIAILTNFKKLDILNEEELVYNTTIPYKLCTFSRVMKEKGIEDAIDAVVKINGEYKDVVYTLDIYGQIEENYIVRFNEIMKSVPNYIQYKGSIPYNNSVEILKNYFLLLFPTRFKTEGIPGTVIDAYASGVPVLASKWDSANEIISDKTGFVFKYQDIDDMKGILGVILSNPNEIFERKINCLNSAREYTSENTINKLLAYLEGE